jgi:HSP20 family protein
MAGTNGDKRVMRPSRSRRSFGDLWDDMDSMWQGVPSRLRMRPFTGERIWPAVDVFTRNGSLVVKADIPGVRPQDIDITVNEDSLTLSGRRSEEKEVKEKDFYLIERSYGRFMRQVPLPASIDRERGQTTFKNGVLEASFPLKERERERKIPIKAA